MKKFALVVIAALFVMIATSGCNAMRGAGTDLSDTGKHIEKIGT